MMLMNINEAGVEKHFFMVPKGTKFAGSNIIGLNYYLKLINLLISNISLYTATYHHAGS